MFRELFSMRHQELGQAILYANSHPKETSDDGLGKVSSILMMPASGKIEGPTYWKKVIY